tara:strand:- start:25805 stop:26794 length:990 start_codon:yes stop_codon:yes gene_type:complete
MTLAHLISSVNSYLQTDFPAVENHPLLSQGDSADVKVVVDELIVRAANSARKWAEMRHDFQCASVTISGTIPAGGSLDLDDINGTSIKIIDSVYLASGYPINLSTNKQYWNSRYEQEQIQTDYRPEAYLFENKLMLKGRELSLVFPSETDCDITIVGYEWLNDYSNTNEVSVPATCAIPGASAMVRLAAATYDPVPTLVTIPYDIRDFDPANAYQVIVPAGDYAVSLLAPDILTFDSYTFPVSYSTAAGFSSGTVNYLIDATLVTTDWFIGRGFEYMQWACIVEVNHMLQTFVPRQEGSLSPPERLRERAFEALKVLDMQAAEGGIYHE